MEMFKNIRLSRGRSILRNKISRVRRKRFRGNMFSAKKIGLVWDASKPDEFQVLSQFHQKLLERNIDLQIIGYYPGKEIPDKITAIRYLVCLKQRDINLTYRPVSNEANGFINTPFDILIDANFKNVFPLEYISSLSLAGLKVGIYDCGYDQSPFDLMLEVNKSSDLNNYLDQVVHYLEMINTGSTKISV
jgi:hypothetical protein